MTVLSPTCDPTASQLAADASKVARSQRGVAPGLTLSPTGRSTRTSFSSPTGFSSGPGSLCLTMNWVKPTGGWPAASSKNWPGVATLQVGVSTVQVPACQPESTVGLSGSLGAMMPPVLALASGAESASASKRCDTTATRRYMRRPISISPPRIHPTPRLPEIDDMNQYFLVSSSPWKTAAELPHANGHDGIRSNGDGNGNDAIPVDWEHLARATAHPLRISILEILGMDGGRTLSPSELSQELQIPLSNTNYHVTELAKAKLIELARQRQVRGATEHFYRIPVAVQAGVDWPARHLSAAA